jgi:ATP-binding cassette subfamily B protein
MSKSQRAIAGLNSYFRVDIYRKLLHYVGPYKWPMAVVVVITILQSGLALLDPWPMKILVDSGLGDEHLPDWLKNIFPFLASESGHAIIIFAVLAGIVLHLLGNFFDIVVGFLKSKVNESLTLDFKADLFNHFQRLSFSYHDRTSVGDSMYRLNNDTGFISTLIWGNFRHLLTSVVTLVGMVWITVQLDWVLAVVALAAAPILYGASAFYGRYFKEKTKRVKEMESASETIIQEVLSCLRVVKAFGQEDREQRRFAQQSWTALRARLRLSLGQMLFSSGLGFVTKVDRSLILLLGGFHVLEGGLTVGELLVILAYIGQIHEPLEAIGETLTDMQLSLASAERTLEVLEIEPDVQDRPGAKALERVAGKIAVENVSFGYREGHKVLHNISFTAQSGEVVAIVGPTGAGKTTLANLLVRFYDPIAGKVTLDGHDLRDLTVKTLRKNIALVIQEPILFTGSIRDNIAYGRQNAKMKEIEEAAKSANAHDFISALPDGYDTKVGERGAGLSGGERQRVAIARAFLMNAPILILDEPTSSVDSRTELVILDALDRLMLGRTTFIIAHRLSTVRYADQILVIEKGRIVERGTHSDLIGKAGLYAQLYQLQHGALRRHRTAGKVAT